MSYLSENVFASFTNAEDIKADESFHVTEHGQGNVKPDICEKIVETRLKKKIPGVNYVVKNIWDEFLKLDMNRVIKMFGIKCDVLERQAVKIQSEKVMSRKRNTT